MGVDTSNGNRRRSCGLCLKSYMEENKIKGTLKVFGTPAEELCIGKPFMAKDGHFKDVDMFFDWHPNHLNRGTACDTNAYFNVKYHFRGRTAHGNAPWEEEVPWMVLFLQDMQLKFSGNI